MLLLHGTSDAGCEVHMKYNGPKVKLSRKLGFAITPKARKIMDRKGHPPGQHGNSRRRPKLSDYAKQLIEKQKLRLQYNVHERQMSNYMKKATRTVGNTGDILVQLLESRLDSLVFRAGLARSMYAARQYVRHGHVLVNGKKVDIPSYQVQPNDTIAIKEKSRKVEAIQEAIRSSAAPPYLE
ncbi:MAG: 30S ribosomal protein S4, partial [Candidatus Kapabacteria bacterium]|nr:30S ribosomal protein S4 [Candidatus Kapabacteria bacterium]